MAEQEIYKVFVGDDSTAREIIINPKDTGFQITNSLSSQFGIFGKKVTAMINIYAESIIFDPERELGSYGDILSLKLVLEDFEDDRGSSPTSRRPSILSSLRTNKKQSRFDPVLIPKMIIASNDVVFNTEKRNQHAYTISLSSDKPEINDSSLNKRRPSSLFAPQVLDMFKNIMGSPLSTVLSETHLAQVSSMDTVLLSHPMNVSSSTTTSVVDRSLDVIDTALSALPRESSSRTNRKSLKSTLVKHNKSFTALPPRPTSISDFPDANTSVKCVLLRINLPDASNTMIKLPEDFTMDTVLQYVCQKRALDPEVYSLTYSDQKIGVEMDRTLKYYAEELVIKEMNLALGSKTFTTMIEKEDNIEAMIYQYRLEKIHVIAASLTKIIERITDIENTDSKFINMTLLTFRSFTTPLNFFSMLMDRFDCVLPDDPTEEDISYFQKMQGPVQKRTIDVILLWVEQYWQDFALNSDLKKYLGDFTKSLEDGKDFTTEAQKLRKLVVIQGTEFNLILTSHKAVEKKGKKMESMFEKMSAEDIGQQLCLYNFQLFRNIHSVEYLYQIWNPQKPGEDEESLTPVLDFFIKRFDLECYWVATEICNIKDLKKRTAAMKKIIKAAQVCYEAQNFFTMFALYFGLNLNPVLRLKKTWEGLSDKTRKIYVGIEKMTDPSRNMKNFRDHLAKCKAPIIPFLPIYLKDLTFMNDGNPSKMNGMINFEKLRMMAHCVRQIRNLASVDFPFLAMPEIQNFLGNPTVERDLAKLKAQSLLCEPLI